MMKTMTTSALAILLASGAMAGSQTKAGDFMDDVVATPEPAVPAAAPRFNWTGAYAGAGIGYGRMSIRGEDSGDSIAGGAFAGYRMDMDSTVLGAELVVSPGTFGTARFANGDRIRGAASLLLSAGIPLTEDRRTLGYVTAGPSVLSTSDSEYSLGATVGLGVDHMLTEQLFVRGGVNYTAINDVTDDDYRTRTTAATVGVGFRF